MKNVVKVVLVAGLLFCGFSANAGIFRKSAFVKVHKSSVCRCLGPVAISDAMPPETGVDDRGVTWLVPGRVTFMNRDWTDARPLFSACFPDEEWQEAGTAQCLKFDK